MPKPKSDVLTEAEQRVMRVIWSKGEASVRDVTEAMGPSHPVAYTTVLTLLRILTDKNYVAPRQEGRAFVYTPTVTRAEARSRALRKLVGQFFEGSPTALAQHLLRSEDFNAEELRALKEEIDRSGAGEEESNV
ncbi:MAG: BlaI/MecI/CopY family transcriptional regulator [Alphaproteobacteria bacterium]|nr:BlaI/MecI/CopY family transcriptional regulator [Alphaproteobacteria bacterium]